MKYVDHYYDIVPRDLKHVAPPSSLYHLPPDLGELFESNPWAVNSLENILFRTNAPSSDIVIVDFGMCIAWTFSLDICRLCVSFDLAVPSTSIPLGNHSRPEQELWDRSL